MITTEEEYKQRLEQIANFPAVAVDTPEEDILNGLIQEISEWERKNGMNDDLIPDVFDNEGIDIGLEYY